MIIEVNNAHTIKLSYSGYNKYTATWAGYEKNTIRRTIHTYYQSDSWGEVALEASEMFTQWLTDTSSPELTHNKCIIESITMGEISADKRVVLVRTDWIESESDNA